MVHGIGGPAVGTWIPVHAVLLPNIAPMGVFAEQVP